MARYKESFTLYPRKMKSGKSVWYYRTYTPDGIRTSGKSTGLTSKTKARAYCENLLMKGLLCTSSCELFGNYALHFFDDDSIWLKDKMSTGTASRPALSQATIDSYRSQLRCYILPFFSATKIENLKPALIKQFRIKLLTEGIAPEGKKTKPLKAKSVISVMGTLKILTDSMFFDGLLTYDVFRGIKPLKADTNTRDAFTLAEVQTILHLLKNQNSCAYIPALVAACTGMRISEILAIDETSLQKDFIDVYRQFYRNKFCPLKTKEARKIPIIPQLYDLLQDFYFNNTYRQISEAFREILKQLKLYKTERGLCFHSLRHFYNTYLLAENVNPVKVAAVLGHSTGTGSMQERYTNWKPEMFPEIYEAQKKLFKLLTE